jgi:linoleoyl-CoA desaturase
MAARSTAGLVKPEGEFFGRAVRDTHENSGQGRREAWRDVLVVAAFNHALLVLVPSTRRGLAEASVWVAFMALGVAGAVLIVLHDAMHSRFSAQRSWINSAAVHAALPVGLWVSRRAKQHVFVHHAFSGVYPMDDYTKANRLLRLHAAAPQLPCHRYQRWYAWLAYGGLWLVDQVSQLRTLVAGDDSQHTADNSTFGARLASFAAERVASALVLLPYLLWQGFWRVALPLGAAVVLGGCVAAVVLAVGHVTDDLADPILPPSAGADEIVHSFRTTASFAVNSRSVAWITGGLSQHLAHHVFPDAPRARLAELNAALIEYGPASLGLDAVVYPSFGAAVNAHYRKLRTLGTAA